MRRFWRSFLVVFYIFIVLVLILTGFLFFRGYSFSMKQIADSKLSSFNREYAAIIDGYRNVAQSLYDNLIDVPQTTEKISLALEDESRRDEQRQALYQQLLRNYGKFTNYDIRQLHFHLRDNTSFIRFHMPEKYGDDLTGIRMTVTAVNSTGRPAFGFEEGRIFNGYRFVFPVFHNLIQVGSVEVSVSMKTVIDSMATLYERPSRFVLSREVMEKKLFTTGNLPYRSWPLSEAFVLDKGIPENDFPEKFVSSSSLESLKTVLEGFPESPLLIPAGDLGDLIIYPVENYSGEVVAYLISLADADKDNILRQNLLWTTTLLIALFLIITILFFFIIRNNKKLNRIASFDSLTGSLSRDALFTRLHQEMERNRRYNTPLSIILFDLDNFKTINDQYGHMTGDAVLKVFAEGVMENSRTSDYLARLGGDEFLLVLPGTNLKGAEVTAIHLSEALHEIEFPEVDWVTSSMGVGETSSVDRSVEHFIDRVDKGLYLSKKKGRDRITLVSASES